MERVLSLSLPMAGLLAWSALVHAESNDEAEALFQAAKTQMDAGQYGTACPMLEKARSLDGGGGTVLLLAVCYEKSGRAATALATYREALALAKANKREDREAAATKAIADLEVRVSRLVVVVTSVIEVSGLEIRVDGAQWGAPRWNAAIPVDGGLHEIEVSAPGKKTWRTKATLAPLDDIRRIEIPPFVSVSDEPKVPSAAEPARDRGTFTPLRVAGLVVGGAAIVSLSIGGFYFVRALSLKSEARDLCNERQCSPEGKVRDDEAYAAARVATIGFVSGAIAVGGAITLWVVGAKENGPRVAPVALPGGGGLQLSATF